MAAATAPTDTSSAVGETPQAVTANQVTAGSVDAGTVGLLQAALGGVAVDPSPLDHGRGKPLLGVCELKLVNWKKNPIVFGLEQFVQVADAAEAQRVNARSYAIQPTKHMDLDKDGAPDFAVVPVLQFAPDGAGGMKQWGEIHFFVARECKVGSVLVVKSGPKP